ncbi:Nitroreductase [Propionispira arboris]|uniref:Nitroreductase n=1 Tax=Propionispira arboris TaxID=84035 RepID=A0A1H7D5T2_9FIRM|nr:nitroreductase family protein [Propionispira arboris]SEJ97126.1 Nitroreductase [Propionispira arboris]
MSSLTDTILTRRSIRAYQEKPVNPEDIKTILTAAAWAPSGNNLQPWKFAVIMNDKALMKKLSALTVYEHWVQTAPCLIVVFLDPSNAEGLAISKLHMKHVQSIGAAIQNMLLTANDLGLGACWIGEILKNEETLKNILEVPLNLELMAVIAVGYPGSTIPKGKRKEVDESVICWK